MFDVGDDGWLIGGSAQKKSELEMLRDLVVLLVSRIA